MRIARLARESLTTLLWFRADLRLDDHPALRAAVERGGPVVPVFIWSPDEEKPWSPGGASRWWLHQSLRALDAELHAIGSKLIIRSGSTAGELERLIRETGATAVYWSRRYEPAVRRRDERIEQRLTKAGIEVATFPGTLLREPTEVATKSGGPFQVFTAYWRASCSLPHLPAPEPKVKRLSAPHHWPDSLPLAVLQLEPHIDWAAGIRSAWQPGSGGAQKLLKHFVEHSLDAYDERRNRPELVDGSSRLSPYLHFGEISPRQIWHAVAGHLAIGSRSPAQRQAANTFMAEIGWREFAYHLLEHFPHTPAKPLRERFANFPWRTDAAALRAWQRGATGYPLVDAGLRQLWQTGWMHNRVRMVVASFLTKHLLLPWQEGAEWFWDTLLDADLANNTLGWQWTAGCGADAAPYFRIFNPVTQAERYDPAGSYQRRWVPELAALPDRWLPRPWEAPAEVLAAAGVKLGKNYPRPLVDHAEARARALAAFQETARDK